MPADAGTLDALGGAAGELLRRDGRMAALCTSRGEVRMDWAGPGLPPAGYLAETAALAASWRRRGIRHVIWAAMGGAGLPAAVLSGLGLLSGGGGFTVHRLDSTDPAAGDRLLRRLAAAAGLPAEPARLSPAAVREALSGTLLAAVSLGASTAEPAAHLAWWAGLLDAAGLTAGRHAAALTVPGSRLEETARALGVPCRMACPGDGLGYPGRLSAPCTAVYLLPAALAGADPRETAAAALAGHDLAAAAADPAGSPWIRLAAAVAARARGGRCRMLLGLPGVGSAMHPWTEMLLEQTCGKDGRGTVVFSAQPLNPAGAGFTADALALVTAGREDGPPPLPARGGAAARCAAAAAAMAGWQVTAALLGWLAGTNIVDEPAVEDYKARTRDLLAAPALLDAELAAAGAGAAERTGQAADVIARRARDKTLSYLDVTVSGDLPDGARRRARDELRQLGGALLGVPVKLRTAPAAYHVSEQAQVDGPPGVVSVRVTALDRAPAAAGSWTPDLLHAQAAASVAAMRDAGRDCWLVAVPRLADVPAVIGDLAAGTAARLKGAAP